MTTTFNPNWSAGWTATGLVQTVIADGTNDETEVIDLDNITVCEVGIQVLYDTTADQGAKVYVLRDLDGTSFENPVDKPWQFQLPATPEVVHGRTWTVRGDMVSRFIVYVSNDSGGDIEATVNYKLATIDVANV